MWTWELRFPLPKKKLPLGEMLAGGRRWLRLANLNIRMAVFVFTRGLFAFQSPPIAFPCFIAQTPNAKESSESSAAKMRLGRQGSKPPTPTPPPRAGKRAAAGRHAGAADPGYHLRTIRQGRSGSAFPAPAAPCQEGTAASLHLCRQRSRIYSFALRIYRSTSLCPHSQQPPPSCDAARGLDSAPGDSRLPAPSPRNPRQEANINPAPAPPRGRRPGTEKQPLFFWASAPSPSGT